MIRGEFGGSVEPIITAVISLMPAGVLNEASNNDLWSALYSLTPDRTISVLKKRGLLSFKSKRDQLNKFKEKTKTIKPTHPSDSIISVETV